MFTMTAKEKVAGKWVDLAVPETLTGRLNLIRELIGKEAAVNIVWQDQRSIYCGKDDMLEMLRKNYPNALIASCHSAYMMIEHQPDLFMAISCMYGDSGGYPAPPEAVQPTLADPVADLQAEKGEENSAKKWW